MISRIDTKEDRTGLGEPWGYFDPEAESLVTRHRVSHWQQGSVACMVTWRLADSLPSGLVREMALERRGWLISHPEPWAPGTAGEYVRRFRSAADRHLDSGLGGCLLRDRRAAKCVTDCLEHFDGVRYQLDCYVVMPNHVHVLFRPADGFSLHTVVGGWKAYSARLINKLYSRAGPVWQGEFWDRLVRSGRHLEACRNYIAENPARARLKEGECLVWSATCQVPE